MRTLTILLATLLTGLVAGCTTVGPTHSADGRLSCSQSWTVEDVDDRGVVRSLIVQPAGCHNGRGTTWGSPPPLDPTATGWWMYTTPSSK